MTVENIAPHAPLRFVGLSSDTKQTVAPPVGSTFYETDTGLTYIYAGSAWVLDLRAARGFSTHALLDSIVAVLGGTKQSFWPFTEHLKTQVFPYGSGSDAGPLALNASTIALINDPQEHAPGIFSFLNDSGTANFAAADDADYSFGNGTVDVPFSAGIWVKMHEALGTARSLVAKYGSTATLREWDFRFDASGQLVLELYDESADTTEIATGADGGVLTPFKWQFCVATYDGLETDPGIHLYLNAVDQNAAGLSVESGAYVSMEDTAAVLMVGSRDAAASAAQVFQGRFALPFVTGKALTQAEVSSLYGLGRALLGV